MTISNPLWQIEVGSGTTINGQILQVGTQKSSGDNSPLVLVQIKNIHQYLLGKKMCTAVAGMVATKSGMRNILRSVS